MMEPVDVSITSQLNTLRKKVIELNQKGNVFGLFACHILSDSPEFEVEWKVYCDDSQWLEKEFDKRNQYNVASLGYSLYLKQDVSQEAIDFFIDGLKGIQKRNLFDGSHDSFPYHPVVFLGLVLGTKAINDRNKKGEYIKWLNSILVERRRRESLSALNIIFYKCIEAELTLNAQAVAETEKGYGLKELAFIAWAINRGIFKTSQSSESLSETGIKMMGDLILTDINQVQPEHAAIIWSASSKYLSGRLKTLVHSPSHLVSLLRAFPAAMKRWRYDNDSIKEPIKWSVQNEREVQDIIWLMLRPYFQDLIDEESLPKFAGSSYKPDFAIISLRRLVEVKYVHKKSDFKKVAKEIMEDSVGYLAKTRDYSKIIAFIYDHSSSVQEHEEIARDLKKLDAIEDVIIVSRPSQLPS